MEKKKKQRNVVNVRHLSSTSTHTKRKKKGVMEKSIAQSNPKFSLSKCVASWTRSNYTITRASFHWVVVTVKATPTETFYYICFI
jgi:tRNA A37 threonylcarbamoyladenosine dehydratase